MGSSNVSEDGTSERVRFDNIVYYSMDEAIEKVCHSVFFFHLKKIQNAFSLFMMAFILFIIRMPTMPTKLAWIVSVHQKPSHSPHRQNRH